MRSRSAMFRRGRLTAWISVPVGLLDGAGNADADAGQIVPGGRASAPSRRSGRRSPFALRGVGRVLVDDGDRAVCCDETASNLRAAEIDADRESHCRDHSGVRRSQRGLGDGAVRQRAVPGGAPGRASRLPASAGWRSAAIQVHGDAAVDELDTRAGAAATAAASANVGRATSDGSCAGSAAASVPARRRRTPARPPRPRDRCRPAPRGLRRSPLVRPGVRAWPVPRRRLAHREDVVDEGAGSPCEYRFAAQAEALEGRRQRREEVATAARVDERRVAVVLAEGDLDAVSERDHLPGDAPREAGDAARRPSSAPRRDPCTAAPARARGVPRPPPQPRCSGRRPASMVVMSPDWQRSRGPVRRAHRDNSDPDSRRIRAACVGARSLEAFAMHRACNCTARTCDRTPTRRLPCGHVRPPVPGLSRRSARWIAGRSRARASRIGPDDRRRTPSTPRPR